MPGSAIRVPSSWELGMSMHKLFHIYISYYFIGNSSFYLLNGFAEPLGPCRVAAAMWQQVAQQIRRKAAFYESMFGDQGAQQPPGQKGSSTPCLQSCCLEGGIVSAGEGSAGLQQLRCEKSGQQIGISKAMVERFGLVSACRRCKGATRCHFDQLHCKRL